MAFEKMQNIYFHLPERFLYVGLLLPNHGTLYSQINPLASNNIFSQPLSCLDVQVDSLKYRS